MDNNENNICAVCGKEFRHRRSLYSHERLHAGQSRYSCCGISFRTMACLQRHRCSHHGGTKLFVCGICSKEFATKQDLDLHTARENKSDVKRCEICGQSISKRDMPQHKMTHSNDREVRCITCGARFKHRSSMYRHMKKKHTV